MNKFWTRLPKAADFPGSPTGKRVLLESFRVWNLLRGCVYFMESFERR